MACGMCGTLWLTMVRLLAHSLGILRLQLCPTMWPCGLAMGWPGLPLPGMYDALRESTQFIIAASRKPKQKLAF